MERKLALALAFALAFSCLVQAKSYSVPAAAVDYYLQPDGTVNVEQRVTYELSGQFTELYLQEPTGLQISNEQGYCEGRQSCSFFTQQNNGWHELVLRDAFDSDTVTAVFDYTISGELLEQRDTAQFFYKLFGDQWTVPIGRLTATVHMPPGVQYTDYFVHPPGLNYEIQDEKSELSIVSLNHPSGTYLEVNMLFPKGGVSGLRTASNYMGAQEIRDGENAYVKQEQGNAQLFSLLFPLLLFGMLAAFAIAYYKYGREMPLDYQGDYEREPPSDLSPAEAAYLIARSQKPDLFTAEIMWLAHKGYLRIEQRTRVNPYLSTVSFRGWWRRISITTCRLAPRPNPKLV